MITNIKIEQIHSHPNNPRKNLGDLTELADSIKARGILQNLTVIQQPVLKQESPLFYIVVIGHRRLKAAEIAGLTEVPCIVADMDEKTQISTMLLENIQRTDLTVYEQARGFQMMLDLGESVGSIATLSGFSETTVRRRVKLMELDQKLFEQSAERGASLYEYAELEKIEDIKTRNTVLETIGTENFRHSLMTALEKQEKKKKIDAWEDLLGEFAEKREHEYNKHTVVSKWSPYDKSEDAKLPDDRNDGTKKYYYYIETWGYIRLFTDKAETEAAVDTGAAERRELRERRERLEAQRAGLAAAEKIAYSLRNEFVLGVTNTEAKKKIKDIAVFLFEAIDDYEEVSEMLGVNWDEEEDECDETYRDIWEQELRQIIAAKPERALLIMSYMLFADKENIRYRDWDMKHRNNGRLDMLYEFLIALGYGISDDEKALRDGTHELYTKPSPEIAPGEDGGE